MTTFTARSELCSAVAVYKLERTPLNHFSTVIGGLEAVPLGDGSRVTLNTDSELQVSLEPTERVVNLNHGEAYFEVAQDKTRPFIVKAGHARVIAVGTQFSVRRDGDQVDGAEYRDVAVSGEDRRTTGGGDIGRGLPKVEVGRKRRHRPERRGSLGESRQAYSHKLHNR